MFTVDDKLYYSSGDYNLVEIDPNGGQTVTSSAFPYDVRSINSDGHGNWYLLAVYNGDGFIERSSDDGKNWQIDSGSLNPTSDPYRAFYKMYLNDKSYFINEELKINSI